MTLGEKELWKHIRKRQLLGLRFRRQHPAGFYILDFYCHDVKLALEVDGTGHDEVQQKLYDHQRDLQIQEMGITVMRFKNDEVFHHISEVLQKIADFVNNKITPPLTIPPGIVIGEGQGGGV